ncbi:unnamed protein product [Pleuronectes platessa]|uniref:Uncharacterized protein n=1 Tax=Pleuronectes platessa TaxID=8262 RepID=A0A9N7Y9W5_PLEPL|nr:unnamed protein product [Pleuronectes platessa]
MYKVTVSTQENILISRLSQHLRREPLCTTSLQPLVEKQLLCISDHQLVLTTLSISSSAAHDASGRLSVTTGLAKSGVSDCNLKEQPEGPLPQHLIAGVILSLPSFIGPAALPRVLIFDVLPPPALLFSPGRGIIIIQETLHELTDSTHSPTPTSAFLSGLSEASRGVQSRGVSLLKDLILPAICSTTCLNTSFRHGPAAQREKFVLQKIRSVDRVVIRKSEGNKGRRRRREEEEEERPLRPCSTPKYDPRRADHKELPLVDELMEDSDPGDEHTQTKTSNQHTAAALYLDEVGEGTVKFLRPLVEEEVWDGSENHDASEVDNVASVQHQ